MDKSFSFDSTDGDTVCLDEKYEFEPFNSTGGILVNNCLFNSSVIEFNIDVDDNEDDAGDEDTDDDEIDAVGDGEREYLS